VFCLPTESSVCEKDRRGVPERGSLRRVGPENDGNRGTVARGTVRSAKFHPNPRAIVEQSSLLWTKQRIDINYYSSSSD